VSPTAHSTGFAEPNKSALSTNASDGGQPIGEAVYGVPSAAVPSLKKATVPGTSPYEFGGNATETCDDHADRMPLAHTQSHGGRTFELGPEGTPVKSWRQTRGSARKRQPLPQVATKQAAQSLELVVDAPRS